MKVLLFTSVFQQTSMLTTACLRMTDILSYAGLEANSVYANKHQMCLRKAMQYHVWGCSCPLGSGLSLEKQLKSSVSCLALLSALVPRSTASAPAINGCLRLLTLVKRVRVWRDYIAFVFLFLKYPFLPWTVFVEVRRFVFSKIWLHCALGCPSFGKVWHASVSVVIIKHCHSALRSLILLILG